jgi:hypothetical protein
MPEAIAVDFLKEHKEIGFVLVKSNGEIVYGNLEKFVFLGWINYKEKTTIPSKSKKSKTKSAKVSNLTHPDTTTPKMMSK